MLRLLFILALAALETSIVSLPLLVFTNSAPPWILLFIVVVSGWLSTNLSMRYTGFLGGLARIAGALFALLIVLCTQLGLWPAEALAQLLPGAPLFLRSYFFSVVALFLYWRGTRISARDSSSVSTVFSGGAITLVLTLLFGSFAPDGVTLSPALLGNILGFISLGLFSMAFIHADEDTTARKQRLSWRWLLVLGLAIGSVVLIGVAATAWIDGGNAAEAMQNILRLILLPFAFIGGLVAFLVITLIADPLVALIRMLFRPVEETTIDTPIIDLFDPSEAGRPIHEVSQWADWAIYAMALIPLVLLIVAIILIRRRRNGQSVSDEERESLGVTANLLGDLRELLGKLRNPFAQQLVGLRAALAALQGGDPNIRVRRAYVRLLLRLEAQQQERRPAQTPAEFLPAASATIHAPEVVATLTHAYEQARYNPRGTTTQEADQAEAALQSLGKQGT